MSWDLFAIICREILFAWTRLGYPGCNKAEGFYVEVVNPARARRRLLLENRDVVDLH